MADSMAWLKFENCGRKVLGNTALFLLATHVLPFYSGRQNTVKTAPQPLFVNKAFVALYMSIILPIGPIPISLFYFELEAED